MADPITSRGIEAALGPVSTAAGYLANRAAPIEIPSPGDLLEALASGYLHPDLVGHRLTLHGILTDPAYDILGSLPADKAADLGTLWQAVIRGRYNYPTIDQAGALLLRGSIGEAGYQAALRAAKLPPDWDAPVRTLLQQIPGASDLVSFVVRDVWSPDILKAFGYDQEYPAAIEEWLGKQGLAYQIKSPIHDAAGLGPFSWAKAYWWSHWQLPSPTQGIQMLQRLRPSLANPRVPRDPSGLIFTIDDLRLLLKTADYPPFWRDRLAAIGYRPIGIRNLRYLRQFGLIDQTGVVEIFQDQGYNLRDSIIQAKLIEVQATQSKADPQAKATIAAVERAYLAGVIGRTDAAVQLYQLHTTDAVALKVFNQAALAQQQQIAGLDRWTSQELDRLDLTHQTARITGLVRSIRSRYLRRQLSIDQARDLLRRLDLDPLRVQEYLTDWQSEASVFARGFTAAQVVRYFERGLIGRDDASSWLVQLGYSLGAADTILTDANLEMVSRQVRSLAQLAREGKRRGRQLQQAAAKAAAAQKAAQKALAGSLKPAQLTRYLRDGLLPEPVWAQRMTQLGVSPADQQLYLREVALYHEQQAAKAAPKPVKLKPVKPPEPPGSALPPIATLLAWRKKSIITQADFEARARLLGYTQTDIDHYLSTVQ